MGGSLVTWILLLHFWPSGHFNRFTSQEWADDSADEGPVQNAQFPRGTVAEARGFAPERPSSQALSHNWEFLEQHIA